MMDVIGRLIEEVESSGKKRWRIAADAGMSSTKLSKILNRKQVPNVLEYIAIVEAIESTLSRMFAGSELVVETEKLRAAQAASQDLFAASERLAKILGSLLPDREPPRAVTSPLKKPARSQTALPVRAAANPNAEFVVEYESKRQQIPRRAWNRGARIIVRVTGDSMEGGADPIANGELAYLKPTRSKRMALNKTVLVRRDDGLYLKKFEMSGSTIRLVSANPASQTIVLNARVENLEIYGYVVDHATA